jgi:hypothetical protein
VTEKVLEKELKKWREMRARKASPQGPVDRRTVRVNGQDVVVIVKTRKTQG